MSKNQKTRNQDLHPGVIGHVKICECVEHYKQAITNMHQKP